MRAVTGRLGRLVVAAAWLFGAPAPRAGAMCNSIPVAQPWFPSERGSIGAPIGGPAQAVRIQLNPACPGENGRFDASSTALVTFVSASGTVDRPAVAQFVDDTHLDVVIPTTVASAGLPNGLAGPARITVTASSGAELARIFELYEPTSGCDRKSGAVFDKFTVLPKPNDVTAATDLLATLDGDANLLIPLDHTNVLPVSPTEAVAAFETGKGFFKVFSGGKAAWEAVKDAIALPGASPADFVEVYSIRGQRLPALALFDPKGSLFGTADAYLSATPGSSVSVLRFPRVYNGQTLYDLSGLAAGPSQPIAFGNNPSKRDVSISACSQLVQLVGLRVSPNIIAYTRADTTPKGVVQIHDVATAGQDCGKSTNLVAANATSAAGISRPALEAGDQLVTFVEQTSSGVAPRLRVFTPKGTQDVGAKVASPLLKSLLDQRVLVPSLKYVFFTKTASGQDTLGVFSSPLSFPPKAALALKEGVVSNGQGAVITPGNAVQVYNAVYDAVTTLTSAAAGVVAISPNLLAFTAASTTSTSSGPGALLVQSMGIPPALPTPAAVGVKATAVGVADMTVVFISSEDAESPTEPGCMLSSPAGACDLNGDGDAHDHVLRISYTGAAVPTETRLPARDFVVQDGYVAFRSPESEQDSIDAYCGMTSTGKCDRNNDGDTNDDVMMVYDLATGTTFSTGQAASRCDSLCTQLGLEWMSPYGIRSQHLFFLTNELQQNQDLNQDGAITDIDVLQIFDLRSKGIWSVGTLTLNPEPAVVPIFQELPDGSAFLRIVQQSNPKAVGSFVLGDADGDGTFDAFDTCVGTPNPDQFDDDCDGLGDRFCDRTYCTDFAPRLDAEKARASLVTPFVAQAALDYLARRAVATVNCLDAFSQRLNVGTFSRDATLVCRGYFVNGVEVFPIDRKTSTVVSQAVHAFQLAVQMPLAEKGRASRRRGSEWSADTDFVRTLLPAYGESTNAATRVVYGNGPTDLDQTARACQQNLGRSSVKYLARAVKAMQGCIQKSSSSTDLAADCIGSLRDGHIVLPANHDVSGVLESGAQELRRIASDQRCVASLASLDACSKDANAAQCISCANWRRAADVVLTAYGSSNPRENPCRRVRPRLKAPEGDHGPAQHAAE